MSLSSGVGGGHGHGRHGSSRGHGFGGVGGGRGLRSVGGRGLQEDPLPRHPCLHCHHEMAVPLGSQTHGTIANVVIIAISFTLIYLLTLHMQNI